MVSFLSGLCLLGTTDLDIQTCDCSQPAATSKPWAGRAQLGIAGTKTVPPETVPRAISGPPRKKRDTEEQGKISLKTQLAPSHLLTAHSAETQDRDTPGLLPREEWGIYQDT